MAFGDVPIGATPHLTEPVNVSMTKIEKKVRSAAVKVYSGNGHGSGSLVKYKGSHFIITAFHVIQPGRVFFGKTYQIKGINQTKLASLVYFDETNDIAVLYLDKTEHFKYNNPMRWNPMASDAHVGTAITYSGYPSWHNLMTFRGHVAGYETFPRIGEQIILNVFGWFGSSGALVYTSRGEIVGVLWAIDVENDPEVQVNEDMVWVSPIRHLNIKDAADAVCQYAATPPRHCE